MLNFIPTPIGNIQDISFRAIQTLNDASIILCEDTRVTKKLINLLNEKLNQNINLNKQFYSVHSHNEEQYLSEQFQDIYKNNNVAYLSDAGMPCVSDPGAKLVQCCINNNIPYDVLPGANALLTAYAMSGFDNKEFTFYGFLPHKSINRKTPLYEIMNSQFITILYEAPHRIIQLLNEINNIDKNKEIFLAKELTKLHQTILKGKIKDIIKQLDTIDTRGEWVVIINKKESSSKGVNLTIEDIKDLKLPPKQKAKLIAKMSGANIKDIYNQLTQ